MRASDAGRGVFLWIILAKSPLWVSISRERANTLVKQAIQESREVISGLRPATLRGLGLVAALRQELQQLEQETRWKVDFEADAIGLPEDVETGLYRIIREAIINAREHTATKRSEPE